MDVKTTFLNGDLDEEVYMKQPKGFVMLSNEHKVCKLVKSLYGLKQAPKQWHQKFDEDVSSSGFHLNQSDKCVYSKFDSSSKGVIIWLYVDDMLIFKTDQDQVDKTRKFFSSNFSMKDIGEADVILGIKIKHEAKEIVITQSHYIEKILKKFNREDCSLVNTPMDPIENLKPNTRKPIDQLEYLRDISCLMYAMIITRPNIAYAIGRLSTKDYGLSYVGYPSVLEGYSDASWINHVEYSSSTSGWVFLLGGGAISRASKKQTCITGSTMEYKFVALATTGKEAEWLQNFKLGYKNDMPTRQLKDKDKRRTCILLNKIDDKLLKRRIMRNLEVLVVQIVLWYLDFGAPSIWTGDRLSSTNFVNNFWDSQFRKLSRGKDIGICDYMTEGVDLLTGSRGNNLYTLSLGDMMASSPICLFSKASKTKSWLWHRRLSHLNFGEINHLARHGLVQGLPKLKFEKDHLCSACAIGKSKKKPYKPKSEDTNQEKLYLLHMDLCGPMRVTSVNGKKYILIIVDDYSRFTWVKCLRSKDEAPYFIIKFLKMIQLRLKHLSNESEQKTGQ
ncbi:zinc finger, CCHC-type containing protein [Tanacetum coccineum]